MISEMVTICEAEKNHPTILSTQFTDMGDPLNCQRLGTHEPSIRYSP